MYVEPKRQVVDVGKSATFNCTVSGHPLTSISWLKDGLPLEKEGHRRGTGRLNPLTIPAAVHIPTVRREDSGMYQCFANNDFESAQGTAELKLGGKAFN